MNNLCLAFSVVFPLFFMMALGYLLRLAGIFKEPFLIQLNSLCFKVFLPVTLFKNVYSSSFKTDFSAKLIIFALVCVAVSFTALFIIVPLFVKQNIRKSVIIQGIFRSNFILFGLPVATSLYGEGSSSLTSILIAFVIPAYNDLSVFALEYYSDKKTNAKAILKGIACNPLILGAAIGFFFVFTGLRLPPIAEPPITDIAKAATPLSLIVLGGGFKFGGLSKNLKALFASAMGKLVLMPAIIISVSVALGFRGLELVALMAMSASPTAVSSYTMAQSAKADHELAGQIVVVNSAFSVISIFFWISILKAYALI